MVEEQSREAERKRVGLEELQEMGRRELDAARKEMGVAAEGLEAGKEELKAARKVRCGVVCCW